MSSSDSDCDYFNNAAQKLHELKAKYREDDSELIDLLGDSTVLERTAADILTASRHISITPNNVDKPSSKNKSGRKKARKQDETINQQTIDDGLAFLNTINDLLSTNLTQGNDNANSCNCSVSTRAKGRNKYSRRCKRLCKCQTQIDSPNVSSSTDRRRPKRTSGVPSSDNLSIISTTQPRRNRTRNRRNGAANESVPTYNIGNFEFYPDYSESVSLFSKPHHEAKNLSKDNNEDVSTTTNSNSSNKYSADQLSVTETGRGVFLVGSNRLQTTETLDEDILNVKVQWQSDKIYIFKIGSKEKFEIIFDFFQHKEKTTLDKMLFLYNDVFLKPEHTLESVDYNIAKIIEGGLLSSCHPEIYDCDENKKSHCQNGITVKFQFKGVKKLFETTVGKNETLCVAMTRCAKFIGQPISKLQFELDGDIITDDMKPSDLELEGGECVDVKIKT